MQQLVTAIGLSTAVISLQAVAQVEEITVTARKTAENLQEIPLAITAFDSETLNRRGINDIDALAQNTAGLVFDYGITNQDTRVVIRGLSPTRGRQNIAFLQDNIDISSEAINTAGGSLLVNPRYLDFERIEVVKGPQSALYGRAAFNGAINYVTKDPGDTFEFEATGDASTAAGSGNDSYTTTVAAGGPLTDTFGLRASGTWWDEDGYYNNPFTADDNLGGGDGYGVSLKGVWQPTESFKLKARVGYSDDEYEQRPAAFLDYNTLTFFPNEALTPQWVTVQKIDPNGSDDDFRNLRYDVCGPLYVEGQANNGVINPETAASDCANNPDATQVSPNDPPYVKSPLFTAPVASFTGKVPDTDELDIRLSPDPDTIDPNGIRQPKDYPGTQIDVLRASIEAQWDLQAGSITSWTGYTDSDQDVNIDFDKFAANPDDVYAALFQSPTGPGPDGVLGTNDDIACSLSGGDCAWATQQIDFTTDTDQISQELRWASSVGDLFNYTVGGLYWKEETTQIEHSATARASDGNFIFGPRESLSGTFPNCYSAAAGPLPGTGIQAFMPDWSFLLAPNFANFPVEGLGGPEDVSVPAGNNFLCPASSSDVLQYLDERANILSRRYEANTDHWSVYGSIDFDLTETVRFAFEGRYTNEREEQIQPILDESDPDFAVRQSPSSIQPNCGQSPDSPMPDGDICGPTIPSDVGVDGIWRSPLTKGLKVSTRSDFFAPRATFEWRPIDKQMYYVSYAEGKKPGGFSRLTAGSGGFEPDEALFKEEKLQVYEIGAKTTLFNDRLLLNVAGYYQDFTDKQVPTTLINSRTGLSTAAVENAGEAEIWGLEVESTWAPTDRITFGLAYTYLDSEYKDFIITSNSSNDLTRASNEPYFSDDPNVGTGIYNVGNSCANISARSAIDPNGAPEPNLRCEINLSGNELEDVPEHSLNLNAQYIAPLFSSGFEWYIQGDYVYQDERYLEQWNDNQLDDYWLVNARAGIVNESWEAIFYVDNVFDDETVRTAQTGPGISTGNFINGPPIVRNQVIAYPAPPRVFGLRIKYTFGR
jgi:outer membrane receptor protein involved in Fe transport